jgi:hypothetical protein
LLFQESNVFIQTPGKGGTKDKASDQPMLAGTFD